MINKIITIFLIFGINFHISAQTMHAIIVSNTEDANIGKSCEMDQMMMIAEMNTIAKAIRYEISLKIISSGSFNFENLEQFIKELKANENDIIFFYYTGHGFNKKNYNDKYPIMDFNTVKYPLFMMHKKLKKKGARLCITMGDCCNNIIDKAKEVNKNLLVVEENKDKKNKIYKNLFLKPKGDIIVSSSKRGEYSYVHEKKGSYFTDEFRKALVYAVNYSNSLSWENLLIDTRNRVIRINQNKVQTLQFDLNLVSKPHPPIPNEPKYTDINKYLNDLSDNNISESERILLLDNYYKYFKKNARVDIFVGKIMTDMKTVEDFLDRIFLHADKIKSINLIENKSKISSDGKKYQQIAVQEIW